MALKLQLRKWSMHFCKLETLKLVPPAFKATLLASMITLLVVAPPAAVAELVAPAALRRLRRRLLTSFGAGVAGMMEVVAETPLVTPRYKSRTYDATSIHAYWIRNTPK